MKKLFAIVFLSIICIFPLGVYARDGATITTLRGVTVDKVLYDKCRFCSSRRIYCRR